MGVDTVNSDFCCFPLKIKRLREIAIYPRMATGRVSQRAITFRLWSPTRSSTDAIGKRPFKSVTADAHVEAFPLSTLVVFPELRVAVDSGVAFPLLGKILSAPWSNVLWELVQPC